MQYRRFGRTELQMPVFSCGGMRYQDGWTDKPLAEIDPKTQTNLEATVGRALEVGINHIETARGYGPSERQLGQYFQKLDLSNLIIQTKVGMEADSEVFYKNALDSLDRLQLERVDLFSLHGINNEEKLGWATRPGGCFEMAERLRDEGRCRFIGFSTHGSVGVIQRAIAHNSAKTGAGFDYLNLHWYYIYQETTRCIEAARARDMGVFIISPSDKGGQLYKAPPLIHELCSPLHPLTFNDLFCLQRPEIDTLSIGASRPSDFEEHLDALPLMENASALLQPILKRLQDRYEDMIEPEFRDPWSLGLPPIADIPGQLNIGRIVQLRNLAKAFDLVDYGKFRYNLLGNAADWFPGQSAAPDNLNPVRKDLQSLFRGMPSGERLMSVIEEAHQILFSEPEARLSQSD
jgi:predicted aldo/keto reductase-like oxidoreductase